MNDLRARRHEQTRTAIVEVAIGLFRERGFGVVTMEEIAEAAGVSRSTVYRRFPAKEDIILEIVGSWVRVWDATAATTDTESPLGVAEACCLAVARHIDDQRDDVLVAYDALAFSPVLAASAMANEEWLGRFVALVDSAPAAIRSGGGSDAELIAGAYMGAIDAVMRQWAISRGRRSAELSIATMLDVLRPIWPG